MRSMCATITAAALLAASLAPGQSVSPLEIDLRPIDQRVSDVGLLSSSLRIIQPGLEVQTSFDQVYRVPGNTNQLMRVQGALRAVYPLSQSTYVQTPWGVTPGIPAGTVFFIGPAGPDDLPAAPSTTNPPGAALRWNTRIENTRIFTRADDLPSQAPSRPIASDAGPSVQQPATRSPQEQARLQRIRQLLQEAQEAATAAGD